VRVDVLFSLFMFSQKLRRDLSKAFSFLPFFLSLLTQALVLIFLLMPTQALSLLLNLVHVS
jgi:hypothetical protein